MQAVSGKLLQAKSRLQISNSFTPIDGGCDANLQVGDKAAQWLLWRDGGSKRESDGGSNSRRPRVLTAGTTYSIFMLFV